MREEEKRRRIDIINRSQNRNERGDKERTEKQYRTKQYPPKEN
jgi:hypothetical protein